jgi:hypothetical protein
LWANIFERLGDLIGREIRYQEDRSTLAGTERAIVELMDEISNLIYRNETASLQAVDARANVEAARKGGEEIIALAEREASENPDSEPDMRAVVDNVNTRASARSLYVALDNSRWSNSVGINGPTTARISCGYWTS